MIEHFELSHIDKRALEMTEPQAMLGMHYLLKPVMTDKEDGNIWLIGLKGVASWYAGNPVSVEIKHHNHRDMKFRIQPHPEWSRENEPSSEEFIEYIKTAIRYQVLLKSLENDSRLDAANKVLVDTIVARSRNVVVDLNDGQPKLEGHIHGGKLYFELVRFDSDLYSYNEANQPKVVVMNPLDLEDWLTTRLKDHCFPLSLAAQVHAWVQQHIAVFRHPTIEFKPVLKVVTLTRQKGLGPEVLIQLVFITDCPYVNEERTFRALFNQTSVSFTTMEPHRLVSDALFHVRGTVKLPEPSEVVKDKANDENSPTDTRLECRESDV